MIRYSALRERFLADTAAGGPGAAPALTDALERIGWRSVGEPSADELASHLVLLLDDCVHGHRDVHALCHTIASVMREVGPSLDGGLPPAEAYLPAAEEALDHYVQRTSRFDPFGA